MKHVTLVSKRCDVSGAVGLVVKGMAIPDGEAFAATRGLLIAHDLLEHQNGIKAIGGIDDELEALGAIWFMRGQFGDISRDGTGSAFSPEENIARDVVRMFVEYYNGAYVQPEPRTRRHEEDQAFDKILGYARRDGLSEVDADRNRSNRYTPQQRLDAFLSLSKARMRIGYRKAARRFTSAIDANRMFWLIAEVLDSYTRDVQIEGIEERTFRLSYDYSQAHCEEIFPDYE